MNQNEMYLTTGEFAKLCHTTKHTLFHYCEIGLFVPAYTDENGYRYYHALQYDLFMTISQMRTTGMSLMEIKSYLEQRSPQRMVELYQQQEQQITRQIAQLNQIRERMTSQRTQIQQFLSCSEPFFVEQTKEAHLLCTDPMLQTEDYTMTAAIGALIHSAHEKIASNTLGMLCSRASACAAEEGSFYFYVETFDANADHIHRKPAGKYLSMYHRGAYETLTESYQVLMCHAEKYKILLDDWIYVETILGDWAVCKQQDYVLKVSIKVTESGQISGCSSQS